MVGLLPSRWKARLVLHLRLATVLTTTVTAAAVATAVAAASQNTLHSVVIPPAMELCSMSAGVPCQPLSASSPRTHSTTKVVWGSQTITCCLLTTRWQVSQTADGFHII